MEIKTKFTGSAGGTSASKIFAEMLGANSDIQKLDIEQLVEYDHHPFKPYSEDKLQELAADIAANGVLVPIIVRERLGKYQILAGHNRCRASCLAELTVIPAIVKVVDDNEAAIIVTTTNLNQRQTLLPSEKAWAYKMQLDAMKRQAGRPGKNCAQIEHNFQGIKSVETIAEQVGESRPQIQRYIRLTHLLPPLLDRVDEGNLPVNAGVELSYLPTENQEQLLAFLTKHNIQKISLKEAEDVRSADLETTDEQELLSIFGKLPKEKKENSYKIATTKINKAIPKNITPEQVEDISTLIKDYFEKNKRR